MAELVDAHDSKSCVERHGSSILPPGTLKMKFLMCGEEQECLHTLARESN